MDGQELIHVNFQLPASALDSLSKLAEQMRKLMAAVSSSGQPAGTAEEIVESGAFDQARFQALAAKSQTADGRTFQTEAQPVRSEVMESVREPESAGRVLPEELQTSGQGGIPFNRDTEEPKTVGHEAEALQEEPIGDIPTVRPGMDEQMQDAPAVRMEPESLIPEAEKVWTKPEEGELPLPAVQAEELTGVETPLGAGLVVTAQPEPPASRWSGMTEELVTPGPAPLTAEAVSLAFQRDGRRYDNGFPLY